MEKKAENIRMRTYSVYIEESEILSFVQRFTGKEEANSRTIREAIRNALAGEQKATPKPNARLLRLYAFRKRFNKTKAKNVEEFLDEILDYLRDNLFYITPRDL